MTGDVWVRQLTVGSHQMNLLAVHRARNKVLTTINPDNDVDNEVATEMIASSNITHISMSKLWISSHWGSWENTFSRIN